MHTDVARHATSGAMANVVRRKIIAKFIREALQDYAKRTGKDMTVAKLGRLVELETKGQVSGDRQKIYRLANAGKADATPEELLAITKVTGYAPPTDLLPPILKPMINQLMSPNDSNGSMSEAESKNLKRQLLTKIAEAIDTVI